MANQLGIYERNGVFHMEANDSVAETDVATLEKYLDHRDAAKSFSFADDGEGDKGGVSNTEETGTDGWYWANGTIHQKDANYNYTPIRARGQRGNQGLFWQMFLESEQYRRSWKDQYDNLRQGHWAVELPQDGIDDLTDAQLTQLEEQRKWTEQAIFGIDGGWSSFIHDALYFLIGGFSVFETVYYAPTSDNPYAIRKMAFRMCSSVNKWLLDEHDRELLGVEFARPSTGEKYSLPASSLMLISYNAFGNDFEGNSPIRAAVQWIKAKQLFAKLEMIAAEKYGVPILAIQKDLQSDNYPDPEEQAELVYLLDRMKAEDNPVIELPAGQQMVMLSPEGNVPDFTSQKSYCDNQISLLLKSDGNQVGTRDVGTQALAETKKDTLDESADSIAFYITEAVNGHNGTEHTGVIKKMVDAKFGGPIAPGLYPELTFSRAKDTRDGVWLEGVAAAKEKGLLTWRFGDEKNVRDYLNLDPITEDEWQEEQEEKLAVNKTISEGGDSPSSSTPNQGGEQDPEQEDPEDDEVEDFNAAESDNGLYHFVSACTEDDYEYTYKLADNGVDAHAGVDYERMAEWLDNQDAIMAKALSKVTKDHRDDWVKKTEGVTDPDTLRSIKRSMRRRWEANYREAVESELFRNYLRGAGEVLAEAGVLDDVNIPSTPSDIDIQRLSLGRPPAEIQKTVTAVADDIAEHTYNVTQHYLTQQGVEEANGRPERKNLDIPTASALEKNVVSMYSPRSFQEGRDKVIQEVYDESHLRGVEGEIVAERSAVMDGETCSTCRKHNGKRALVGSSTYSMYSPPNFCKGKARCRCIWAYIHPDEEGYQKMLQELRDGFSHAFSPTTQVSDHTPVLILLAEMNHEDSLVAVFGKEEPHDF